MGPHLTLCVSGVGVFRLCHVKARVRFILKPFRSSFCFVLSFLPSSNGQGDEEGWCHEGDEEGDEEGGRASCGCREEASNEEGHEGDEEGSHEESHEEEGLIELSPGLRLRVRRLFKAVGSACPTCGQVGSHGTCTFEVCRSSHVEFTRASGVK